MICSQHTPSRVYIGSTNNIHRRLGEHNNGTGSKFTEEAHYAPWCLVVLVTNFPGDASSDDQVQQQINKKCRGDFETTWQRRNKYRAQQNNGVVSPRQVYEIGLQFWRQTIQEQRFANVTWLQCGRVVPNNADDIEEFDEENGSANPQLC